MAGPPRGHQEATLAEEHPSPGLPATRALGQGEAAPLPSPLGSGQHVPHLRRPSVQAVVRPLSPES